MVHVTDEDGIRTIQLNDEAGKNALSEAMVEALLPALGEIPADCRAVVLAGLPNVFCAGGSHELLARLAEGNLHPTDIWLAKAVLDLPVPSIAAMEGHAIGGGLALGVAADIVIMGRESRYGCSFLDLGFTPGMGITGLLEHVFTRAVAHELLYTGERRKGIAFDGKGINYVLPKVEVLPKAMELAGRIAEKPRYALEILKRNLSIPRRQLFENTRTSEALMHEMCFIGHRDEVQRRIEGNYVR